jgi:hypothetical protein
MRSLVALVGMVVVFATAVCFAAETPQVPPELAKLMEYYVGTWSASGTMGDVPITGRASFRMLPGNPCMVGSVQYILRAPRSSSISAGKVIGVVLFGAAEAEWEWFVAKREPIPRSLRPT